MAKQKERNSDEFYRGIIRQLKSEVRSLRRELQHLQKYQDNFLLSELAEESIEETVKCPKCANGAIESVTIGNRQFDRCNSCIYRTVAKKI